MKLRMYRKTHIVLSNIIEINSVKTDMIQLPTTARKIVGVMVDATRIAPPNSEPNFMVNTYYFGVGTAVGDGTGNVAGLNSAFVSSLNSFTIFFEGIITAGANEHIYYAHPTTKPEPFFMSNGFVGGFQVAGNVNINMPNGEVVPYKVWRSTTANLGQTTITVTNNE